MKKPQWITIGVAIFMVGIVYCFARITPLQKSASSVSIQNQPGNADNLVDTMLNMAKRQISTDQLARITAIEHSITRGAVKEQQLNVYHQLAHFWRDSAGFVLPYAWYEAEAARLENSEKSLTFAARLFLDNLQEEQGDEAIRWEAMQAKDLFERSLRINPSNDSAKVGLGACYLFGNISSAPMEGIAKIREVLDKDSTNVYALWILAKASKRSEQYDKAISRLQTIIRLQPNNLEAILLIAEMYEKIRDNASAIKSYQQSLKLVPAGEMKTAIEKRIRDLKK